MIRSCRTLLCVVVCAIAACGPGVKGGPTMSSKIAPDPAPVTQSSAVVSKEILDREPLANTASVKHILIGWSDLADQYQGHQDKRAAKRTKADAEAQVRTLVEQITAGGDFDALMKEHSEDVGSATTGRPFTVTPDAQLVIEFRQLSLRLKVGEVGVVQSDFGFHIIKRLE
ncbi:MAG: peptidylprolyl isomerase [Deltaproteobacteria bacterium]|nr:peptidylprolyl isomerase [Deltaproteobacteria bacterium]